MFAEIAATLMLHQSKQDLMWDHLMTQHHASVLLTRKLTGQK